MQDRSATCLLRPPAHSRLSRDKRAGAPPLRWLSLGMRVRTRACDACAPRCDGFDRSVRYGRPLHQRKPSNSVQGRAVACLLRPPTHSRLSRDKRTGAPPLRWLSLRMRRSTRACDACAPCCDGRGRPARQQWPLHQREASYSVQGHAAACPLRPLTHSRGSRDKRAGAPALRWLSLGRRRSTRARNARAVRFAGSDWPMRLRKPLHQREASHSLQSRGPMCQVRPPTQPAFA